jgi:hypothetical protein
MRRADFSGVDVGLETTLKRPIINTWDESHADPVRPVRPDPSLRRGARGATIIGISSGIRARAEALTRE